MPQGELSLLLFCYLQPSVIGFLLFILTKQGLLNKTLFSYIRTSRKKLSSVRFFECATYSRLLGQVKYDIQVLAFAVVFLIYDADLVFFISEATHVDSWSISQATIFLLYFLLFVAGLWYDIKRQGLRWSY